MKTIEKLAYINKVIGIINDKVLVNNTFKIVLDNSRGANNYCLLLDDMTLKFNTYDDMISGLDLLYWTLKKAQNERGNKRERNTSKVK